MDYGVTSQVTGERDARTQAAMQFVIREMLTDQTILIFVGAFVLSLDKTVRTQRLQMALLLPVFTTCLLLGCGSEMTQKESEFDSQSWIGKSLDSFQDQYGESKDIGSGVEVYEYVIRKKTYLISVSKGKIINVKETQSKSNPP